MLYATYNPQELEPAILTHWQSAKIIDKWRKKNENGQKFYFLDGPPYTSGKFHLGHAWNYALKDICLRYKRSRGFNVWDRNGFDVHGLPTEHKVMDKHGLKTKDDIQKFGVDRFVVECEKFCLEMADVMTKDLERMGVTVRIDNPYMALKTEFIEGEWALIKKAYQDGRMYLGKKSMTWCGNCETALAKHELEYQSVTDKSVFVKLLVQGAETHKKGKGRSKDKGKGKNKEDEFLIVWTTTPWTIAYNLAVMAHPEIDYVKAKVGKEIWILAKVLAAPMITGVAGKKFKIIEEFKGKKLKGIKYLHPFADTLSSLYHNIETKHKKAFTVVLSSQYVDTTAGTGLVHCAPGCGPEDFEVGQENNLPPFNNVSDAGFYPGGRGEEGGEMGEFSGYHTQNDNEKFINALDRRQALIATTDVEHEYPHCWRCHKPVIFKTTDQWFFKVEDLREKILDGNKNVHWVPDTALHAYEAWIRSLKDNSISRQRYWGTPLPIWKCQKCEMFKVVGSRKEIKDHGGKVPDNLHLPWIDAVELSCACTGKMRRVPDVIDVWVDAGTTSWNCLDNDPKLLKQLYPADLILEAKEQTRLWFSMLSICSYLYLGKNAFRNVYVYGMLNDIEGRKMSKSLGNIISPYELIDKHGVDVLRYYMCSNNAGQDINFSWEECAQKHKHLNILWNIHKLLISLAKENKINPYRLDSKRIHNVLDMEEKYIISKLHSTIQNVTELFEAYRIDETIAPLEELFLELSRTYIQMIRDKSSMGEEEEKELCIFIIGEVLLKTLKMFSIICPFMSEAIYLNLREEFAGKEGKKEGLKEEKGLKEESINFVAWPVADKARINPGLEHNVKIAQEIIQGALNCRERAKLGLRWPVKEVLVETRSEEVKKAVAELQAVLQKQLNAKAVKVVEKVPGVKLTLRPEFGKIGPVYGDLSPVIVTRLKVDSPETVLSHLEKENVYAFRLEGPEGMKERMKERMKEGMVEVKINRDMVKIERVIPPPLFGSEIGRGVVYVNAERTEELDGEGYVRELTRHIQQLRKEAGLEKLDRINLFLLVSPMMKGRVERWKLEMEQKVGAEKMEISLSEPSKRYFKEHQEFSIKEERVGVWMEKV